MAVDRPSRPARPKGGGDRTRRKGGQSRPRTGGPPRDRSRGEGGREERSPDRGRSEGGGRRDRRARPKDAPPPRGRRREERPSGPRTRILVATHNRGKMHEILHRLGELPLELRILDDLPEMPAPVEDGATFTANARKKALHYSRRVDHLVLAEDSGLMVDALDGAPGVRSARFAGAGATDADRIRLLLTKMDGVRWEYRTARFVCVAALARQGEVLATFEGKSEGMITLEPEGSAGFGYDPVFRHEGTGKTYAEMTREEKAKVSHRGQALDQLALWVRGHVGAKAGPAASRRQPTRRPTRS